MSRLPVHLALTTVLGASGSAQASRCPRTSAELARPGPYLVGVRTVVFVDTGRPTPANGTFPGAATAAW